MAEFYTVITTAGREAVARATQAGVKVDITHMAIGDGGGVPVTPNESQTQLVNECWRGLVATYSQQGSKLIIDSYIPPDEASFITREMGLFTADGVLFAVCNTPEMRKVLPSEGAVGSFVFGMELDITDIDMRYIEIHTNPMLDFIPKSEKGQPDGVATLDENSKVLKSQIPELDFDPKGSAAIVQKNLNTHINNKKNPHGVTAAQVGAYTKTETNNLINASKIPTGSVFWFAANNAPNGFLICDGAKISRTTYSALFNIVGTAFGAGDGSTTFDLPNLINEFIKGSKTVGTKSKGSSIETLTNSNGGGVKRRIWYPIINNPFSSVSSTYTGQSGYDTTYNEDTLYPKEYYLEPHNITLLPCIKY